MMLLNPLDAVTNSCGTFSSHEYRRELQDREEARNRSAQVMMGRLYRRHKEKFSYGAQSCAHFDSTKKDHYDAFPPKCKNCGAMLCRCMMCGRLHHANGYCLTLQEKR